MLHFLQRLALATLGVAVGLGLAEAILRATDRLPSQQLHSVSQEQYGKIPGLWEPEQSFVRLAKPELPHHVRINSLGLRGPETTLEPRGPRVIALGDSFTFGDFVDDTETLPARLDARITAEVLNAGVGGTTIVDQRVFLERLLVLQPDLVLLVYSENDLADLHVDPPMHEQLAKNRELKSGWLAPLYRQVRDTSLFHLALRIRGAWRARLAAAETRPQSSRAERKGRLIEDARRYADEVAALRDDLAARSIQLCVTAFPSHFNVHAPTRHPTIPALQSALAARGIELLDLTGSLRESGLPAEALYLLPHDGHPSPRGYSIAAAWLARRVEPALASTSCTS